MLESTFLHEMKGRGGVDFGDYTLYSKPCEVYNRVTEESERFKNVAEALEKAILDGKPLKELVKEADMHIFDLVLDDTGNLIQ